MKSFTIAISLLFLFDLAVVAGRVEHTYHFRNPSSRQAAEYHLFELENTMLTALTGQPILPYSQVKLLLPPGESAIRIEIIFSGEIPVPGKFNLFPQQDVRPVSAGSSGVFSKDYAVYSRNATYPVDPKGQLITSFINGRSVALTTFTPVRYNPVSGILSYYSNARVIVHTAPDLKALKALDNLDIHSPETSEFADNKEKAPAYLFKRHAPAIQYDLLVVCTAEFKNAFANYQADYLSEGITSQVVILDSIISTLAGFDVSEKIRNFIIQEYHSHGIKYVLLAGDAELIPYRGLYCYVQSGSGYTDNAIPSDLYYSALDGNWNTDGDALWGEPGEEDLLPDVAVGRMPFSNVAELEHMLNKSYKYQFTPVLGEFRNVLMAGESLYQNPVSWGSDYLNMLKGSHSENGYTTSGIPADYLFDNMYDEAAIWTAKDLMNHLNQGRPMLNHAGHSNITYAMRLNNSDITNANFSGLNGIDHNFTMVYTHGCDCGAFDYKDCIAENMVTIDNFAVAFIGNSRYGWFNEGQTEGPSLHLHREFIDALYKDSLNRIGRAHMESKIASAAWVTAPGQWEPGALRWCFYDCNVLGDPALALFTDNPITIKTVFPSTVALESPSMNISVSCSGLPASGLTCVALKGGVLIGKSVTDKSGNAILVFDMEIKDPGMAQLIISGYNCVPVSYDFEFPIYSGYNELTENQASMTVYPNPAKKSITLDAQLNTFGKCIIKLLDNQGRTVVTIRDILTDNEGRINKTFNISSFKPGRYVCEVKSGNLRISTPFIVY